MNWYGLSRAVVRIKVRGLVDCVNEGPHQIRSTS